MLTRWRYIWVVLGIFISFHYIVSFTNDTYRRSISLTQLRNRLVGPSNKQSRLPPYKTPIPDEYYLPKNLSIVPGPRANAAILMLARNNDLNGVVTSMKQMEDRFNKKFQYPYIFLNDADFDGQFIKRVLALTDAQVQFGRISEEHWVQPANIDEERAKKSREDMVAHNIIYGGSVSYRNMCRFNSGFFYRHELLKRFKYYWRVEPDVKFFCDIDYDPFLLMEEQNKMCGFNIALYEFQATIPSLWSAVKGTSELSLQEFIHENPELISPDNAMAFLTDDDGKTYNLCHFWSNFEIANLELWRSPAYTKFFEFLDNKGGFYYERWGDAPVHSIAASLFLNKSQMHFFYDIGYRHEPFEHCPDGESHKRGKCWCDSRDNFDYQPYSCYSRFEKLFQQ